MKRLILIVLLAFLAGCGGAKYSIKIFPDGRIEADARSYREYALFTMDFNPITKLFSLKAVGVTDDTDEIAKAAISVGGVLIPSYLLRDEGVQ